MLDGGKRLRQPAHFVQCDAAELGDLAAHVRDDRLTNAQSRSFFQAKLELWNGQNLASESQFAHYKRPRREWTIGVSRRDRHRHRQIYRGLDDLHAADDVDEDVVGREAQLGALLEYRDDHRHAVAAHAADLALGCADHAGGRQRLHLDEQYAAPGHRGREHGAARRSPGTVLLDEQVGRVLHLAQAFPGHLEQPDLVRAAEAVLHAAHDAVRVKAVAFEIDDRIDDVLD